MHKAILILILISLVGLVGCERLVIEKRSLFVSLPPDSNEVNVYYLYQGISLRNSNNWSKSDLDALRDYHLGFPLLGSTTALRLYEFEDLRFFVDPTRKRQLCADRRMTIRNRYELAEIANQAINEAIKKATVDLDEETIKQQIKSNHAQWLEQKKVVEGLIGPSPWILYIDGSLEILEQYDVDSIRQIVNAAHADFRWIRFESDTVRLVFPATSECARRITSDPVSIEWLESMRANISPIELLQADDGLALVLGSNAKVICLNYADDRPHDPAGETKVRQLAENPRAIIVNGRVENVDSLIETFIFETTGYRTWNDVTGKFSVTAKFGGIVDGKVLLLKENGSKVYVTREQLGTTDRSYLDVETK